ncbi:MAG: beta-propeller domain-containing protein [Firmicutes bacterium]|nr:beta-propeller domain-containing protein [Bacillota bacterium]
MRRDKDFEYIQKMFDEDGIKAPESLSEENMRGLLDSAEAKKTTTINDGAKVSVNLTGLEAEKATATDEGVKAGADLIGLEAEKTTATDDGTKAGADLIGLEAEKTTATDDGVTTLQKLRAGKRWRRSAFALAACAVLVIGLVPVTNAVRNMGPGALLEADDGMFAFENDKQLDRQMHLLIGDETGDGYTLMQGDALASADDADVGEAKNDAAGEGDLGTGGGQGGGAEHSDTYTQVEGVDEADIVKTDGKYIYFTSMVENQVIIASAKEGVTERVAAINCSKEGTFIQDMYLADDRLVLIGMDERQRFQSVTGESWSDATCVFIYDISNPEKPEKLTEYSQTGSVLSSRLIGNTLCLVTNDYIYTYQKNKNIPYICFDGEIERIPLEAIKTFPEPQSPVYTVVGLMDITTGDTAKKTIKTSAILGGSQEIYCNGTNLYITSSKAVMRNGSPDYSAGFNTQILKVSIADGKIKTLGSATVPGDVNNQFSMDEKDGYFKVASSYNTGNNEVNGLFIFNEKMKEVGSVSGFARDESIKAVRYVKDKAYVITYEETDPLFIIDLSNPAEPVIEGHVKISGFSTLLVPTDADHLLGIGFSTEGTEFGEATNGLKLTLFDVSNPSEPKVADSREFVGMDSEVQYNHKALLSDHEVNYLALPYTIWNYEESEVTDVDVIEDDGADDIYEEEAAKNGVLVVTADGSIEVPYDYMATEYVSRCVSIGSYIYVICDDDHIESFDVK